MISAAGGHLRGGVGEGLQGGGLIERRGEDELSRFDDGGRHGGCVGAGEGPGSAVHLVDGCGPGAGAVVDAAADLAGGGAAEVEEARGAGAADAGVVDDVAADQQVPRIGLEGVIGPAGEQADIAGQGIVSSDVDDVGGEVKGRGSGALAAADLNGLGDGDVAGKLERVGAGAAAVVDQGVTGGGAQGVVAVDEQHAGVDCRDAAVGVVAGDGDDIGAVLGERAGAGESGINGPLLGDDGGRADRAGAEGAINEIDGGGSD